MTIPPPAENQPQGQPVAVDPGFEIAVHSFWEKNRIIILGGCIAALLVIIGREGWQFVAARHEEEVRQQYARIADRPEQLSTFAAANAGHALAGVAYLRLADTKFVAGDFKAAAENYKLAATALQQPLLLGRAKLGLAMSQLDGGDRAGAEASLKALMADATLPKGTRAEAAYHLGALASESGNSAEVGRLIAEIGKIDPTGVWAQRAANLLAAKAQL